MITTFFGFIESYKTNFSHEFCWNAEMVFDLPDPVQIKNVPIPEEIDSSDLETDIPSISKC